MSLIEVVRTRRVNGASDDEDDVQETDQDINFTSRLHFLLNYQDDDVDDVTIPFSVCYPPLCQSLAGSSKRVTAHSPIYQFHPFSSAGCCFWLSFVGKQHDTKTVNIA